ncbi:thiamine pyrophosphate-requiring protein [uncultured Brachybacterium sp.]|uniref:thiamine pyrophosphate-requiring protein n=1 Tax=uncultured Brachybacterium sp. TaxID=189680 RepID=UPI00262D40D0|nr:thiamine pyrophosphate-requiring protein [uncultured Brachybacterium sp.]
MRNVADGIIERAQAWGVQRIFGYAGDGVDPLLGALRRREDQIELITARHEEMAAFMATGHAKYTGEVGVCLATQGPGAVHLLTGLYDAKLDGKPVVAIVGHVVTTALGSGYQQEVELPTLLKDVCSSYVGELVSPEQLDQVVDDAFRTALATSSPTCIIVPHDIQQAELPEMEHAHGIVPSAPVTAAPRVLPREEDLDRAAEVLSAGERVALLVGQGAQHATAEVQEIAERLGAGVTTSLLGKPFVDESLPYVCGTMGHLGTTASADLLAGCDTLLIVGSNDPWTEFYPAPGQARAVQIDLSAAQLGRKYPIEVGLAGDASETLHALLQRLEPATDRPWRGEVEEMVRTWRRIRAERSAEVTEPMNPQSVIAALSEQLPAEAQVSVDVGSVVYWYARHLELPPGVPAHLSSTLASMGSGLPYGLAAKFAAPDRPVVALCGDGAMQMNGNSELITLAHHWRSWDDPRFVVLVLHNRDLAEVSWEQREMEGEPRFPTSQEVPWFPYAEYARLLGLEGIRIERAEQIGEAWQQALSAERPMLIEAVVDPNTPLLPPRAPQEKVEKMFSALAQEDADATITALRRQREQEAHDDRR